MAGCQVSVMPLSGMPDCLRAPTPAPPLAEPGLDPEDLALPALLTRLDMLLVLFLLMSLRFEAPSSLRAPLFTELATEKELAFLSGVTARAARSSR